jgi:phosphoglycerate dehydrogenase-like enzyme
VNVILHFTAGPVLSSQIAHLCDGHVDVTICPPDDKRKFAAVLPQAEVLWHVLEPATEAIIDAASRLKMIQKIGVGINTIDLDAARARGIAVCNLPGTNARAVAELTLMLMLTTLRRLPYVHSAVQAGRGWSLASDALDAMSELGSRTIGLIGCGATPRILIPVLLALGSRVIYHSRTVRPDIPIEHRPLDSLLGESDVVSLHVPLTPQTERLIDAKALARMQPGSVLINTARGGLVDQVALANALAAGHLGAAGLDVFAQEPVDHGDPLLRLENVVLTPHIAWLTTETFGRSLPLAVENCRRLEAGRELLFRVA